MDAGSSIRFAKILPLPVCHRGGVRSGFSQEPTIHRFFQDCSHTLQRQTENLKPGSGKFKDASVLYTSAEQINIQDLKRWLGKAENIQWDYRNIVKRKGKLERLK